MSKLEVFPCFGTPRIPIPEADVARRLEHKVVVIAGTHQESPIGLAQCVIDVKTNKRYDVQWISFWNAVMRMELPPVDEMEVLAEAASGCRTEHDTPGTEPGPAEHE